MGHLISAAAVVDVDVDLEPGWVEVRDGTIVASGTGAPPRRPDEHHDGILAPGLIDAQVNGAYGADFAAASSDQWDRIVDGLPSSGVTAIAPTFITAPVDDLVEQLRAFRGHRERLSGRPGATRLLGAHVEGPFISAACKGAHDEAFLVDPTPERVDALLEAGSASGTATPTTRPPRGRSTPGPPSSRTSTTPSAACAIATVASSAWP